MFARCLCSASSFDLNLPSLPLVRFNSASFIPAFFKYSSTRSQNASPSAVTPARMSSWNPYPSSASSSWPSTLLVLGLSASSACFCSSIIPSFRSLSFSFIPCECIIMTCCSAPLEKPCIMSIPIFMLWLTASLTCACVSWFRLFDSACPFRSCLMTSALAVCSLFDCSLSATESSTIP